MMSALAVSVSEIHFSENGTVFLFLPAFCQQWGNVNELPFLPSVRNTFIILLANIPFSDVVFDVLYPSSF